MKPKFDPKLYPDIYFTPAYGQASSPIDGGEPRLFEYEDENGKISHLYVLRKIPEDLTGGEDYYDLSTPYGYGGPIILECQGDREALVKGFAQAFTEKCQEGRVVSEFVRFHPLEKNVEDFDSVYQTEFHRHTIATHVDVEDPIMEFSKKTRKNCRRVKDQDLDFKVFNQPESLDVFTEIYYDTMERNEAEDFYYFDQDYFQSLLDHIGDQISILAIYKDGLCIASGLYFHYKKYAHAHLSGTRAGYLKYSPAYMLKYYGVYWAKEMGCEWFHYGGGTTDDPDDGLFRFKKKFSKTPPFDFYIGKKVYLEDVYKDLCQKAGVGETDFFPAYRASGRGDV